MGKKKYYPTLDKGDAIVPMDKRLEPENLVRLAEEALAKANEFGIERRELFFAERYLLHWNESRAAQEAGFSERAGTILLGKTVIRGYIDYRLSQFHMSASRLLAVMSEHIGASMDAFVDDNGVVDLRAAKKAGKLHLVKSLNVTVKGISIQLVDAVTPMRVLAEYFGLVRKTGGNRFPPSGTNLPKHVEDSAAVILAAHQKATESAKVRAAEEVEETDSDE